MTFDFNAGPTTENQAGQQQDQNLASRITILKNAVPLFSQGSDGAQLALQFAQGPDDNNTMIRNAQIAASQMQLQGMKDQLEHMGDPAQAWQTYNGLDSSQKKLLAQTGYVAPPKVDMPKNDNLFSNVVGGLVQDVKDVTQIPGIKQVVGEAGKGISQVQHAVRAVDLSIQERGLPFIGRTSNDPVVKARGNVNSISDFLDLWDRTGNGAATFTANATDRAHQAIPEADKYDYTQALASGLSTDDYLQKNLKLDPSSPTYLSTYQKYSQYQIDPTVQNAVKDLKNNNLSLGRDAIGATGLLQRGTLPFNVLSGGIDATFDIFADPTLIAGNTLKAWRASQFGIDVAKAANNDGYLTQRIDQLMQQPRYQRAADLIATRFNEGNPTQLMNELPQVSPALQSMTNYFKDVAEPLTADHVGDYFKSNSGLLAMQQGAMAVPHFADSYLPALTEAQRVTTPLRLGIRTSLTKLSLADLGLDQMSLQQLKDGFGVTGGTAAAVQSGVADFLTGLITKVPKQDFIQPAKPVQDAAGNIAYGADNSIQTFRAMLDYGLPREMQENHLNQFLQAPTLEAKRDVYNVALDAMWHYSGAATTDAGKRLLTDFKSLGTYSQDATDLLNGSPAGFGAKDMADAWGIPSFRDFIQGTKDNTVLRKVLNETNDGIMTRFMNTWRPAVLLRAGFVPRAYGEEMLSFIGREGLGAYTGTQLARIGANDATMLPGLKQAAWLAGSMTDHIPLIPASLKDSVGMLSSNIFAGTNNYLRDFAAKLAPDDYLATAREFARDPSVQAAFSRVMGTYQGFAQDQLAPRIKAEMLAQRSASGEIEHIPVTYGDITTLGRSDLGFYHAVLKQMRYMGDDPLFTPLIDAGRRAMLPAEGQGVADLLSSNLPIPEGASYGRTILNARQYVPDVVMPHFEQYLKNSSFAFRDSVVNDLVSNGMEHNDASQLLDTLDQLTPRQRVSIFTRDGELERMHKARMADPNAAWDTQSDLPFVRGEVEKYSAQRLDEHLLNLWSDGYKGDAMQQILYDRLHQGDMQEIVQKARRGRETLDNRKVATDVLPGTRRVYTLMVPPDPNSGFEQMQTAGINPTVDAKNGWTPLSHAEVEKYQPGVGIEPPARKYAPAAELGPGPKGLPAGQPMAAVAPPPSEKVIDFEGEQLPKSQMAWFTSNHQNAQQILDKMGVEGTNAGATLGYTDIPERVFRRGQDAATTQMEGGLDPLAKVTQGDQVYIPKQWRQNFSAISEDNVHVAPSGELSVGATQQEALRDWAYANHMKWGQVFGGGEGDAGVNPHLQDVQHKLLTGSINLKDLWDLTPNQLPEGAVGPRLMMAEKSGSWIQGVYSKGFDKIQSAGDAMIRQPMMIHYYTKNMLEMRPVLERIFGNPDNSQIISDMVDKLTGSDHQVRNAWNMLHPDVQGAANPLEAAYARDPIHEVLRALTPEQLKEIGNASEMLYLNGDPSGLNALKQNQGFAIQSGAADDPRNQGLLTQGHIDDAKDAYLSFDPKTRARLLDHGVPEVFPDALMPQDGAAVTSDDWSKFRTAMEENKSLEQTVRTSVLNKSMTDMIPFIHDHHLRSQFQEHARNITPFWFAQENFIRRLATTVIRDPTIVRKAQLLQHGMETTGIITKNQYGEEVFNIPATGALTGVLARAADYFGKYTIPMTNPFTGQLSHALPGLAEMTNIAPSFSPIVTVPVSNLARRFPELGAIESFVSGGRQPDPSAIKDTISQIVPGYLNSFFEGMMSDPKTDVHMLSSEIQAAQMLEAGGHGLSEQDAGSMADATKKGTTLQQYFDRLQNHTRLTYMLKGIAGFFSPASPSVDPTETFTPEFQKLLGEMPLNDAVAAFVAANPDAKPYTIFKTKATSGAPLPATAEVEQVLHDNPQFIGKYPDAAPWLLPQSRSSDAFSASAYNQQLAMGLRERKSLTQWYSDYYFAAAAPDYFATDDAYKTQYQALQGNAAARQQLTQTFQDWKASYLALHPVFAETLNDPKGKEQRARTLSTMEAALNDPNMPQVQQAPAMGDLIATFKGLQADLLQYKGTGSAMTDYRAYLKNRFENWGMNFISTNPQVSAFYNRVIRPDLRG